MYICMYIYIYIFYMCTSAAYYIEPVSTPLRPRPCAFAAPPGTARLGGGCVAAARRLGGRRESIRVVFFIRKDKWGQH